MCPGSEGELAASGGRNDQQMNGARDTAALRQRLYEAYASQHAGHGSGVFTALTYHRDIRPLLPHPKAGSVVDIGCGQGALVRLLIADGYDAVGVDISPEQVAVAHAAGLSQVRQGDYRDILQARRGQLAAVTATDVLEHLTKEEVLETFDAVATSLIPGGVLIARVPNAVSPFGGHIRYGDFTHESWFTARSVRQLATAAGFDSVAVLPCTPVSARLRERDTRGAVEDDQRPAQAHARRRNGSLARTHRYSEPDLCCAQIRMTGIWRVASSGRRCPGSQCEARWSAGCVGREPAGGVESR